MAKEKICGIYKIENIINKQKYIGQSVNIYKRWDSHRCNLRADKHINIHLQKAWNKYGEKSFYFEIIEKCSPDQLNEREIYWIKFYDTYNNGYNFTSGGETSPNANKHSVILLNNLKVFDTIKDAAESYHITRKAITKCCNGIRHYAGQLENEFLVWMYYSDYLMADKSYIEHLKYYINHYEKIVTVKKPVVLLNTGEIFLFAKDATKKYSCDSTGIGQCCKNLQTYCGKDDQLGNLYWMYYDDYIKLGINDIQKIISDKQQYTPIIKRRKRPVVLTNTMEIFSSISEAETKYNIHGISSCCQNKVKSAGKMPITNEPMIWKYLEDIDINRVDINNIPKRNSERIRDVFLLNTSERFDSINDAANAYDVRYNSIYNCLSGKYHSAGVHPITKEPLVWSLIEDPNFSLDKYIRTGARKIILLNTLEVFNSIKDAATMYDLDPKRICESCRGLNRNAGVDTKTGEAFRWMYYEDYLQKHSNGGELN